MLRAMNLHVLHRPSLRRVIFGGEGEVFGVFSTYEGIVKVARAAVGKKRWIFKALLQRSEAVRIG